MQYSFVNFNKVTTKHVFIWVYPGTFIRAGGAGYGTARATYRHLSSGQVKYSTISIILPTVSVYQV